MIFVQLCEFFTRYLEAHYLVLRMSKLRLGVFELVELRLKVEISALHRFDLFLELYIDTRDTGKSVVIVNDLF